MPSSHRAPLLDLFFDLALLACSLGPAALALWREEALVSAALVVALAQPAALGWFATALARPVRGVQLVIGSVALAVNLVLSGIGAMLVGEAQAEAWEGFALLYCGALAALVFLVLASTLATSLRLKTGRRKPSRRP